MTDKKNNVNHEEINYEKLWLEEKIAKLQIEAQFLQLQFTKVQEQLQLADIKLSELQKNKKIKETVNVMKNAYGSTRKEK